MKNSLGMMAPVIGAAMGKGTLTGKERPVGMAAMEKPAALTVMEKTAATAEKAEAMRAMEKAAVSMAVVKAVVLADAAEAADVVAAEEAFLSAAFWRASRMRSCSLWALCPAPGTAASRWAT